MKCGSYGCMIRENKHREQAAFYTLERRMSIGEILMGKRGGDLDESLAADSLSTIYNTWIRGPFRRCSYTLFCDGLIRCQDTGWMRAEACDD